MSFKSLTNAHEFTLSSTSDSTPSDASALHCNSQETEGLCAAQSCRRLRPYEDDDIIRLHSIHAVTCLNFPSKA